MAALENSQRIYPCMYMNFIELCGRSCVFYSNHIFASFATRGGSQMEDHPPECLVLTLLCFLPRGVRRLGRKLADTTFTRDERDAVRRTLLPTDAAIPHVRA